MTSGNKQDNKLIFVTHADCEPWDQNPRTDAHAVDAEMEDLIASVSVTGVRQSLTVRPHPEGEGRYQIAAGARRWYALGRAIQDGRRPTDDPLPVCVEALDDFGMKTTALAENLQRKPMTALEEAEAYWDLARESRYGDKVTATIAERVGKSRRHVQAAIALARNLSPAAKKALNEGWIKPAHAKVLTGVSMEDQERFIEKELGSKPLRADRGALRAMLRPANGTAGKPAAAPRGGKARLRRPSDPVRARAEALRSSAMVHAIAKHPDTALRLSLLLLARQVPKGLEAEDVPERLKTLLDAPGDPARWHVAASLTPPTLRKYLARVVALATAPRLASLAHPPEHISDLLQVLELDRAVVSSIDMDWLRLYPKSQLLEVAVQCGAFAEDHISALEKQTPAEIRAAILQSDTRDTAWVPPELIFVPPGEHEHRERREQS